MYNFLSIKNSYDMFKIICLCVLLNIVILKENSWDWVGTWYILEKKVEKYLRNILSVE